MQNGMTGSSIRHGSCLRKTMTKDTKEKDRMEPYQVLVIEDQEEIITYCNRYLADEFDYHLIKSGRQVEAALSQREYDLVLLDKNFSHLSSIDLLGPPHLVAREGIAILKKIKSLDANLPVILITGYGDAESVSDAFRLGAFDYVEAEVLTMDEMILKRKMENAILGFSSRSQELVDKYNQLGLVGKSRSMIDVFRRIEEAIKSKSPILLLGETGVGKDKVAEVIHKLSNRSGEFVTCDMTQTELLESRLFGIAEKSATNVMKRDGLFLRAHEGVLFLNEIGELPLEMQAKLLISVENCEFYPVGSNAKVRFDARIIAATNRDLSKSVESGQFRRDLYARLNHSRIVVPDISKRREDIPLLVRHFVDYHCNKKGLRPLEITDKAMMILGDYTWSENVRQIKRCAEHLVDVSDGLISIREVAEIFAPTTLPATDEQPTDSEIDFRDRTLDEVERDMIVYYLKKHNGDVNKSHQAMGISRATFYSRINHYNLKHLLHTSNN
jgi:DNA-binding NtrC family response regulator